MAIITEVIMKIKASEYYEVQTLCMRMESYIAQERYKDADKVLLQDMAKLECFKEMKFAGDIDVMIANLIEIARRSVSTN